MRTPPTASGSDCSTPTDHKHSQDTHEENHVLSTQEAQTILANGGQVIDSNDDKIGKVGQVFLDDETGEPAWVTVKTGMFGGA